MSMDSHWLWMAVGWQDNLSKHLYFEVFFDFVLGIRLLWYFEYLFVEVNSKKFYNDTVLMGPFVA